MEKVGDFIADFFRSGNHIFHSFLDIIIYKAKINTVVLLLGQANTL